MGSAMKVLALVLWSASIPWAFAQNVEEIAQEPFRGLRGVGVLVDAVKPEGQQAGLVAGEVQTQVERRLREAGVRVLTREEAVETPGMPYLYVYVDTTKIPAGSYAYAVRVSLNQGVALDRNVAIKIHTETWNSAGVGAVAADKLQQIGKAIDAKVDEFIAAYQSAAVREPSQAAEKATPQTPEREEQQPRSKAPEQGQTSEQAETQESLEAQPAVATPEQGEEQESQKPQEQIATPEDVPVEDDSPQATKRGLRSSGSRAGNAPRR